MKSLLATALALVLASCAGDSTEPVEIHGSALPEQYEGERLTNKYKTNAATGFKQDDEGNWIADYSKRSSLEYKGRSSMDNRDYKANDFQTKEVRRPSFWGNKDFNKPNYAGHTDGTGFRTAANDANKNAREGGLLSLFSSKKVDTQTIAHKSATEERHNPVRRISDAETDARRDNNFDPVIIDYQQHRALEIQQTKSMLGR